MKGNGFRRIERLMGVSHVSVINWVKHFASKFKNLPKKCEKVDIIALDEMCVSSKKIWLWTAVSRKTKRLVGFHVGDRSSKSFEILCENISHIDAKFYATDQYSVYDIIPRYERLIGKAHIYTVERMSRLLCHYFARFAHKTYCLSKSFNMIINSTFLFLYRDFFSSIRF